MRAQQVPGRGRLAIFTGAAISLACASALAQSDGAAYEGKAVSIGNGTAHTIVRTDSGGKPASIGIVFTEKALQGLPSAGKGEPTDFPYRLPMPQKGPKTVVDHVVVNWESTGHPPAKVFDVAHFDFHFYLIDSAYREKIRFKSDADSGDPSQQPPQEILAAGYVVPPGTAVPKMGVHAVNPAAAEFNGQPFTATFIYGYHDRKLTFLEPMASLAFLKSKPTFSAPVTRPATYSKPGAYPSRYSIKYDAAARRYEVSLEDLQ